MKRSMIAAIAACGVMLGGCQQAGQVFTDITGDQPTVANVIGDAAKLCSFVLDQSAAQALVQSYVGASGWTIAKDVCTAVGNLPLAPRAAAGAIAVPVHGISVTGRFTD